MLTSSASLLISLLSSLLNSILLLYQTRLYFPTRGTFCHYTVEFVEQLPRPRFLEEEAGQCKGEVFAITLSRLLVEEARARKFINIRESVIARSDISDLLLTTGISCTDSINVLFLSSQYSAPIKEKTYQKAGLRYSRFFEHDYYVKDLIKYEGLDVNTQTRVCCRKRRHPVILVIVFLLNLYMWLILIYHIPI